MRIRLRFVASAALLAALASPAVAMPPLDVRSSTVFIMDSETGTVLYAKNEHAVLPIASITKLMTAIVVLDAGLDLDERILITEQDQSRVKFSRSRLAIGSLVTRDDLLRLALMASDNRAAAALARTYPGGTDAAVAAMNAKTRLLGLEHTRFVEPTGLSSANVSSAPDLAKLTLAARDYPVIRDYSTLPQHEVTTAQGPAIFNNTNGLVRKEHWQIDVQKTGFISEAGRCLVFSARLAARPVTVVLLQAGGAFTHIAVAMRVRQWLDPSYEMPAERPVRVARAQGRERPALKSSRIAAPVRTLAPTRAAAPMKPVKAVAHARPAKRKPG